MLIQGSEKSQEFVSDLNKLTVLNSDNKMVPFSAFMTVTEELGLDNVNMYNMYESASIICIANPKYSSSEAMKAMEALVEEPLGDNFGYQWTSVAYQEQQSGSQTSLLSGLALLVVFLVLAAQYESWTSPVAALLGVPIALVGEFIGWLVMKIPIRC